MLVVDLGGQYSQLIARRVREARVYSELVSHRASADELRRRDPAAIVLSGGPASVYSEGAPRIDPAIFELGIPTLGICYGAQLLALELGGRVDRTGVGEFGKVDLHAERRAALRRAPGRADRLDVASRHGRRPARGRAGRRNVGAHAGRGVRGRRARRVYGVQFHPEVVHTPHGQEVLKNFLYEIAGAPPAWTPAAVIEEQVERIRAQVGRERVLCALSGGVDSRGRRAARAQGGRRPAHLRLRRPRPAAPGRGRAGRRDVRRRLPRAARPRAGAGALPRAPRRRHRARAEAEDHRRGVHPGLRGRGAQARGRPLARAGNAVQRRDRVGRHRRGRRDDQVAPQRRRPARPTCG